MRFTLVLAAAVLMAGCSAPNQQYERQIDCCTNAGRTSQPAEAVPSQAARDQAARDYCGYQAGIANATQSGSMVRQAFAGIEVQAACLQYYAKTGRLPGQ